METRQDGASAAGPMGMEAVQVVEMVEDAINSIAMAKDAIAVKRVSEIRAEHLGGAVTAIGQARTILESLRELFCVREVVQESQPTTSGLDLECAVGDAARREYVERGPDNWVSVGRAAIAAYRESQPSTAPNQADIDEVESCLMDAEAAGVKGAHLARAALYRIASRPMEPAPAAQGEAPKSREAVAKYLCESFPPDDRWKGQWDRMDENAKDQWRWYADRVLALAQPPAASQGMADALGHPTGDCASCGHPAYAGQTVCHCPGGGLIKPRDEDDQGEAVTAVANKLASARGRIWHGSEIKNLLRLVDECEEDLRRIK